jgi:hypothetical protein
MWCAVRCCAMLFCAAMGDGYGYLES